MHRYDVLLPSFEPQAFGSVNAWQESVLQDHRSFIVSARPKERVRARR